MAKTKTNALEIIEHKVNWLDVINMAFNRQDWGKTFNLFVLNDVKVEITMFSFNFSSNYAEFKLEITYDEDEQHDGWDNYGFLQLYLSNYSIGDMNRLVTKKIISLLQEIIRKRLKKVAQKKYYDLHYDESDEIMEEFGDKDVIDEIGEISNENARESALSSYLEEILDYANVEFNSKVTNYVNTQKQSRTELYDLKDSLVKTLEVED